MKTDVIIIGGGAAGLCAAVYLKQKSPELTVRILEALPRVGKKLITTGNGRCNITNKNISLDCYHGENKEFCRYALEKYDLTATARFFENIGIPFIYEGDKAYPSSLQAGSVVDCLRFMAEELGVIIHTDTKVTNINVLGDGYKVVADRLGFATKNVIAATGGLAGGEKLGCDGSMLEIMKKAGFNVTKLTPSIVQIKTVNDISKQLKGIKVDAQVSLKKGDEILRQDFGEVLFTDYGLSGPPILQVSRNAAEGTVICLDFAHEYTFNEVVDILTERRENLKKRTNENFLTGFINKRVGQCLVKNCGLSLGDSVSKLTDKDIKNIAFSLKKTEFKVLGNTGFNNSQVTAGGILADEVDENLESKRMKGLFFAGEILDIDGDCGGFNLQWAFSSGMLTAGKAIECLRSK